MVKRLLLLSLSAPLLVLVYQEGRGFFADQIVGSPRHGSSLPGSMKEELQAAANASSASPFVRPELVEAIVCIADRCLDSPGPTSVVDKYLEPPVCTRAASLRDTKTLFKAYAALQKAVPEVVSKLPNPFSPDHPYWKYPEDWRALVIKQRDIKERHKLYPGQPDKWRQDLEAYRLIPHCDEVFYDAEMASLDRYVFERTYRTDGLPGAIERAFSKSAPEIRGLDGTHTIKDAMAYLVKYMRDHVDKEAYTAWAGGQLDELARYEKLMQLAGQASNLLDDAPGAPSVRAFLTQMSLLGKGAKSDGTRQAVARAGRSFLERFLPRELELDKYVYVWTSTTVRRLVDRGRVTVIYENGERRGLDIAWSKHNEYTLDGAKARQVYFNDTAYEFVKVSGTPQSDFVDAYNTVRASDKWGWSRGSVKLLRDRCAPRRQEGVDPKWWNRVESLVEAMQDAFWESAE